MKKKKLLLIIPVAVLLIATLAVGGFFLLNKSAQMGVVSESGDVFYRNDLLTVGADPDVLYVSEGPDAGYYYMYITSDDLHGAGFLAYKSRDLVEWVCAGVALKSEGVYDEATGYTTVSYAFSNYWAPEVIYDQETQLYYMFYTANRYDTGFQSATYFFGDIAVSESPAGPFVQYNKYMGKEPVLIDEEKKILAYEPAFDFSKMDPTHPLYETDSDGYMKIIDLNPFIDPKTGQKYVYFCHDLGKEQAISESSIYVMALNEDYTPDYSQMYALTSPNRLELEGTQDITLNEGSTNEAPYMLYNEQSGKYYLLYSANAYYQKTYCVRVAVGDSPTGPFRKLTQAEGGYLLYADSHWTWASGTGHCSVVSRDGQDYIVYHAHLDRVNGNSKRGIAMDQLHWVENGNGLLVPVANGPSAALMPLTTYQYENVAGKAKITADHIADGNAEAMTDGIVIHRDSSFLGDTIFDGSAATVKLQFEEPETVCGIAVYNSYDYDYLFSSISSIRLQLAGGGSVSVQDLAYDWDKYYTEEGYVVPGGSIAVEFDPVEITGIQIAMPAAGAQYAISEIAVMAKRQDRAELAPIQSDTSWAIEAPADDTVEFDGIVNPEEYKGDKISFADTNGVTMTMYSKMAEDGVFFGFHSNDTRVYVNPEQAIFQNTSVEIQLGKGGTENLNANVIQLRYGLNGLIEGWIGVNSTESYEYMRTYIETVSKVHIYGELNSANCTGYDVEAYVPYSALNLTEKPDSLICAPSFNTRKDYDASGRTTWTLMVGSSFQDPTSWYRIDAEGQTVMTDGFRVQDNQITQTGGSNQFYYFDDELSDAYYVNVDIQVQDILNGDPYPKFGLVSKSLDSLLGYYLDYAGGNVSSIGRIAAKTTEFTGTQWQWETNSSKTFGVNSCVSLTGDRTVNVELIRYENQLVMLVNGRFVLSDVDVKGLEDGSIPGLFFFNTAANITVNAYQTDKQLVKHYMGGFQPEIAIDGDLGDWAAKTQLAAEKDSASGNEMTVYGYQTDAGVYLAYEVKHGYQPKVYMWNEGKDDRGVWYYNTNAEFWINHTHFAATAFGDSGYMVKSMVTTEDMATGRFATVVEVFVPREVIGDQAVAVGFAFKTCDQDYSSPAQVTDPKMKFRGDPWWYFNGRFPTDMAKRFLLENADNQTAEPSRQEGSYSVNVLPTANGVVEVSAAQAKAGDKLRLTLTPKEGYQLISLTANGKPCGQELDMPGEDLYIVARFGLPYEEGSTEQPKVYPQGTFFGSAGNYHSSDVLNMSTDQGKNPYLVMDAGKATPLYAYVKGLNAKQFYVELTAQVTGVRSDEKYPKFGLLTNDGKEMVKFYLDMTGDKQVGAVGAVHQKTGKEDDWAGQSTWNLNKKLDLTKKTVKLGLLRDGSNYYLYVNGQLVAAGSDLSGQNAAAGIFSFGTSLKLSDYKLVKSGSELDSLLAKAQADANAFSGAALSENYFSKAPNGVYSLSTDSDAQHLVDDVTVAGKVMREKYYSLSGQLTLTDADTWGQARILVSADPKNEYFIALEKVAENSYQIFTMSKANEEGWNEWLLIESAELNGKRNSIAFEVLVNGDQLYFLIDNEICYTSSRVSMTESTVKFTGYNVGTTHVKNLSLQTFADSAAAAAYVQSKQYKPAPEVPPVTQPEGTFFGSAGEQHSSDVLDMTTDAGENPFLTLDAQKATPLYAYVKDLSEKQFYVELTAQVAGIRADESYPKFGIMTHDGAEMVKLYLDMTKEKQVGVVGAVHQISGGEDDWAGQTTWQLQSGLDLSETAVKLSLLRNGKDYYFYVNGQLEAVGSDLSDLPAAVGVFSFGTSLKLTDYRIVTSGSQLEELLNKAQQDLAAWSELGLTTNYFEETEDGIYSLTTDSNAEHKVDDVILGRTVLKTAYYSLSGKLTLTDAGDWGQARILISADPKNEYFIALEKTNTGNYQIFTMSKANEEGWNNWQLIESASHNGSRNAIDFEVILNGDQLYFLIDNEICYKSSRVSMTESTVKFTGYNMATTAVENLSVQVFSDSDEAAAYAGGKESRYGENFGVSEGTYFTTDGVELDNDKGDNPTAAFVGGAPQYAYLNDLHTDKFCFETEINVEAVLNNDAYPKFGIMVNGSSQMVKFFVDMTKQMTATHVGVVYQPTGGGDDWAGSVSVAVPGMAFTGSNTVKLKLIREGSAYYFYVNDTLVLYDQDGFAAEKGAVGIFSFNSKLTASGYSVLTGADANSAIQSAKDNVAELNKLGLTCNWFTHNGNGGYTLTTDSSAEHKVDDLTRGGSVLKAAYYSVKGKLTLTNAADWGQARILISAGAKNEYFIALEKTNTGKYQIFTMSKANQNGWDAWELILHQDTNGTRNSIDFEVLVIGNKLYFLIEDQVVYTKDRVSMTESTVKFTGYNRATTTVEDLSARVFETKQEAEAYLTEKN